MCCGDGGELTITAQHNKASQLWSKLLCGGGGDVDLFDLN